MMPRKLATEGTIEKKIKAFANLRTTTICHYNIKN
jgi:hypothetical protein